MDQVKVVVELHEGAATSTKLWRFNPSEVYTLQNVCSDVLALFPHLLKKGLTVELSHVDDFVGKVYIAEAIGLPLTAS